MAASAALLAVGVTPAGAEPSDQFLWSIEAVIVKTGLSRVPINRYMQRGLFPDRRHIGPDRVAWVASENPSLERNLSVLVVT